MSIKLNSKTLFEKVFLLSKLEKIKGVGSAMLNDNKNRILLLKSNPSKINIKIIGELHCETQMIGDKEYVRLTDDNQMSSISRSTKGVGDDDDYLIGIDDN